jgi:hypothetical protein
MRAFQKRTNALPARLFPEVAGGTGAQADRLRLAGGNASLAIHFPGCEDNVGNFYNRFAAAPPVKRRNSLQYLCFNYLT